MRRSLRDLVFARSGGRCEYCHLREDETFYSFHVEHIIPRQHDGADSPDNLALSCRRCNLYKGPNLTAIDPLTESIVSLYDPRQQSWDDHFQQLGQEISGLTPTGRATVRLLRMNDHPRTDLRGDG